MTRPLFFFAGGVLILIQTAGITSLPGIFAHIPLTLGVAAYLLNDRNIQGAWVWIIAQGIIFELFHLSPGWVGQEFLAHTSALLACIILSRSVFTNRSFYGLAACAAVSTVVLEGVRFLSTSITIHPPESIHVFWVAPFFAIMIVGCLFFPSRLFILSSQR